MNGIDKVMVHEVEQDGPNKRRYAVAHVLTGTQLYAVFTTPLSELSEEHLKDEVVSKANAYLNKHTVKANYFQSSITPIPVEITKPIHENDKNVWQQFIFILKKIINYVKRR